MSPLTHLIGSWLIASTTTDNVRDRKLVTLAGIIPDADGLGVAIDLASAAIQGTPPTFEYYQQYHHVLLHGWPGALALATFLTCFARHHWRVLFLCLLTFHLHLLCDFIGSRGPEPGDIWPVYYGEPFFRDPVWLWKGQWRLDGWQNKTVFVGLFILAIGVAIRTGHSFAELLGNRLDSTVVNVLRKWRGQLSCVRRSR